jgi:hypothetical protein
MEKADERSEGAGANGAPRWDLTAMGSAYCNIATATATRDAVAVSLGVSQHVAGRAPGELQAELLHRIVLTPRTATHLHRILGALLGDYEAQRGERR